MNSGLSAENNRLIALQDDETMSLDAYNSPEKPNKPNGLTKSDKAQPDIQQGIEAIKNALSEQPESILHSSGVYRMFGHDDQVLYVGKAKELKNRVISYTRVKQLSRRIALMVSLTRKMMFLSTHTEAEALLLEAELIKRLKPRFNILLRDDKSFPEMLIGKDHDFPRLMKHRGAHNINGDYFGPYANVHAVNLALDELQKSFRLRTCSDSIFKNRTRPCLLYQMKRCSAPCVDRITLEEYQNLIRQAGDFLRGKSTLVQQELAKSMEVASAQMEYEKAAEYRDRLAALTQVQSKTSLPSPHRVSADVMSITLGDKRSCVYVYLFRQGRHCGAQAYFIHHGEEVSRPDTKQDGKDDELKLGRVFAAFIGQFYQQRNIPELLLVNHLPSEPQLLCEALRKHGGHIFQLHVPLRGDKKKLTERAESEALSALNRREGETDQHQAQVYALAELLSIPLPERIEAYDNSHLNGSRPVGVMVVADSEGLDKKAYRKFNIKGDYAKGDDYAFMREVLERRLAKLSEDNAATPDMILVDGGKGQVSAAQKILQQFGLSEEICLAGIVKGPGRDAKRDRLLVGTLDIRLSEVPKVALLIQRLRDEAHRFAIGAQRTRRKSDITQNRLDGIEGVGQHRKRLLLRHFGSAKAVSSAGIEDLKAVSGISAQLAQQIYHHFRG